ncbi:DNA (cytosine-5-)-methyltransferase [Clostridium sp. AM25-23AC]|uniref:DNA (cytosine-5-)-methyltransferase n=1 Tax=Clostridium sp. AM25-23AC TaxID=2305240 RepID=UPI0015F33348|nr:DNA (cytosine-5-)-methyltransferase [Clostridium sp. AM25-23AC]
MMTLGSLFDGIGGFPLAAVHCGGVPVWASEIEPFPMRVTKLRFPDMIHVGDITKLDGAKLPPVDVICGGSPCQDLSVAGLRKGLAGERSGLFMDQVRIVKEMRAEDERRGVSDDFIRPRYLVWENVPGAFSSANGEDFRAVIEEIVHIKDSTCHVPRPDTGRWESAGAAILGDQFSLAWRVLDAQYWGVAQRRRRIFLVADFGGLTAPKILFEQERLLRDPAEGQGQGKGVTTAAGNSSADSGGSRVAEEKQVDIFAFHINQREETINLNGISGALMATTNMQMQTFVAEGMRKFESAEKKEECLCLNDQGGERMDVSVDITATLRAGMSGHPPLVMGIQQGSAGTEKIPDPALTEEAETGGNNQQILFENHGIDARYTGPHEVAPTMSARYGTGGNNVPLVSDMPESYCIAGNIIDREVQNGGNGLGCQPDISYTLTSADRHAVFSRQRSDEFLQNRVTATQSARQHKDATDLVCEPYQNTVGTIGYTDHKGINNQYVSEDKCIVENRKLIRRLTPLECERLQGFPDHWTDIPGASDSARYKALGNSVAIPCVDFVLRGIAYFLRKMKEEKEP